MNYNLSYQICWADEFGTCRAISGGGADDDRSDDEDDEKEDWIVATYIYEAWSAK